MSTVSSSTSSSAVSSPVLSTSSTTPGSPPSSPRRRVAARVVSVPSAHLAVPRRSTLPTRLVLSVLMALLSPPVLRHTMSPGSLPTTCRALRPSASHPVPSPDREADLLHKNVQGQDTNRFSLRSNMHAWKEVYIAYGGCISRG